MTERGKFTDGYNRVSRWGDDPPRTMAVIENEGDNWIPFVVGFHRPDRVHAILFEDGSVWDALNGWRKYEQPKPDIIGTVLERAAAANAY